MTAPHNFSNTASGATLAGSVSTSATAVSLDSFANFPAAPFTATIDRNQPTEEIVLVTAVVGSTVTMTRGYDGASAQAHSAGAAFEHTAVAKHFRDASAHVAATTAHGTTSAVVGVDDVQTLTNKTVLALLALATAGAPALTADAPTGVTSKLLSLKQAGVEKAFVDYLGNLTAQAVTGTTATFSGALQALATTLGSLTVTGAATLTGPTTIGALTASTVHATGAADFDSTLNVDSNVTVGGTATVAGILGAPVVEFTGAATPAVPAAGKYRQWTDTNGRLQLRTTTANHRFPVYTIVNDWAVLSTHKDGDFAANVSTGERRIFDESVLPSGGWVQVRLREVANTAARNAIAAGDKYDGYQVREADTDRIYEWDGSAWVYRYGGSDPSAGWVEQLRSTSYSYSLTASMTTVTSGSFSVTVPPGRTLDVEFKAPRIVLGSAADSRLLLVVGGVTQDAQHFSLGAGQSMYTPVGLTGSVVGAGSPVAVAVQAQAVAGAGSVIDNSSGIGPVILRYRIR